MKIKSVHRKKGEERKMWATTTKYKKKMLNYQMIINWRHGVFGGKMSNWKMFEYRTLHKHIHKIYITTMIQSNGIFWIMYTISKYTKKMIKKKRRIKTDTTEHNKL